MLTRNIYVFRLSYFILRKRRRERKKRKQISEALICKIFNCQGANLTHEWHIHEVTYSLKFDVR